MHAAVSLCFPTKQGRRSDFIDAVLHTSPTLFKGYKDMHNIIICRYHEIATKGDNRLMFEEKLIENLKYQCSSLDGLAYGRVRGRIYIRKKDRSAFSEQELQVIIEGLKRTAGLENFSPALECKPEMDEINLLVRNSVREYFDPILEKGTKVEFRVRARRSDKQFPLESKGIEIAVATEVEKIFGASNLKVNLTDAAITIGIEVREDNALVYYTTYHGAGGLPTGSNSPVLALLSGGIDSPVACKMIMTRGCHVDYLTFHSFPYTPMESLDKVKRLAEMLNKHQKPGTLYACNIANIQKKIRDVCNPKYRTVLYRRMMMRIANMICYRKRLYAIVTGESVGQVASQTVINLGTIDNAAEFVVIRPLCGMDKQETIRRATELGTFPISIEPAADSCTVFAPPSPAVAARLSRIEAEEALLGDMTELLEEAYNSAMESV